MTPDSSARRQENVQGQGASLSLPNDIPGLLSLIDSSVADMPRRRKAYARLVSSVRGFSKGKPHIADEAFKSLKSGDLSFVVGWTLAEIATQFPTISVVRPIIDMHCAQATMAVVQCLYATSWITEQRSVEKPVNVVVANREDALLERSLLRINEHPLLQGDPEGVWPSSDAVNRHNYPLDVASLDEALPILADIGLPGARELLARRAVLNVRQVQEPDKLDATERKQLKSVLELAIAKLQAVVSSDSPTTEDLNQTLNAGLQLPRFIGPLTEVWAMMDSHRASLLRATTQSHYDVVSHCMLAMPSISPKVSDALRVVSNDLLLHLLGVTLDSNQKGMAGRIRDILFERARLGGLDGNVWRPLHGLVLANQELEPWWRNVMSRFAPEDIRLLKVSNDESVALDFICTCSESTLLADYTKWNIADLSPGARFTGYLIAVARLTQMLEQTRSTMLRERKGKLHHWRENVSHALTQLGDILVSIPEVLKTSAHAVFEACDSELARLEANDIVGPTNASDSTTPERAKDVGNVIDALFRLERYTDSAIQAKEATVLHKHLLWLTEQNSSEFTHIARDLPRLPSEAVALVAAIAVERDVAELRRALPSAIEQSASLRTAWRAQLIRRATTLQRSHKFDESLAAVSAKLLRDAVQTLQRDVREIGNPGNWEKATSRTEKAVEMFTGTLEALVVNLGAVIFQLQASNK